MAYVTHGTMNCFGTFIQDYVAYITHSRTINYLEAFIQDYVVYITILHYYTVAQ